MEENKEILTNILRNGFGTIGLEIALGITFVLALYTLYRLHIDPKSDFKFEHFFMKDGKASTPSLAALVALGTGTWLFVYVAHTIKLSEENAFRYFVFI